MLIGRGWNNTNVVGIQFSMYLHLQVHIILPAETELKILRGRNRTTKKAIGDGKNDQYYIIGVFFWTS